MKQQLNETALALLESRQLGTLVRATRDFMSQAKAPATIRAYRSDWRDFEGWCQGHAFAALPATPESLAMYLSSLADTRKVSTITRRLSAISQAHQMAGHPSPTRSPAVRLLLAGIRRVKGTAPRTKAPTLTADIRRMVAALPAGLLGIRDRALLLVGFAGAFRRSELVGLDVADLEFTPEGVVVTLRHSKTDQEGAGRKVGIPFATPGTCPVHALRDWLRASGITEGPIFRYVNRHGQVQAGRLSSYAVALVVKRHAAAVGLEAAKYAGHSLRAGLATSAAIAGVSERSIMNQTGHRSVGMVRRYIRDGSLFRENAAGKVGL